MKQVYLLYCGNAWLNTDSFRLLAVCSTKEKAIELAKEDAENTDESLSDFDLEALSKHSQTNFRDCNYVICIADIDTL